MDWKLISLGSIGLFAFLINAISQISNQQYSIDANEKAVAMHTDEIERELNEANNKISLVDALNKRENKEIQDEINSWKRLNNFESRKREVHRLCENEMVEFKDSINYYDKKQSIIDAADDELQAFKESIDFDYEVKTREKIIDEAKSLYKKKCKLYDVAASDDSVSEDAGALKAKAKSAMDETVKDTKSEINELKNKVEAEKNKINRKKQNELRALEYELQSTKTRLNKQETEQINAIEKEFENAKKDIRQRVIAKRTDDEISALSEYDKFKDRLSDQKIADADCAMDIYNNTPAYNKIAAYLKSIKCPKWFVGLVGILPMVPAGYLFFGYAKFVMQTISAMQ